MQVISKSMANWLLIISVYFFILGFGSIFTQSFIADLFGSIPHEPDFIRISGAFDVGISYLLFKAFLLKRVDIVKPLLQIFLFTIALLFSAGLLDWVYGAAYGHIGYITWLTPLGLIWIITFLLYHSQS